MNNIETLEFEIKPEMLKQFQSDLDNLVKVDNVLKIKISADRIMMYAKAGEKRAIHAFKSYIYDRDELIVNCNDDEIEMDFIIINTTNFAKSLKVITAKKEFVKLKIEKFEKEKVGNRLYISDGGKINLNFLGGGYLEIRDFTFEEIENQMDPDLADFQFTLDKEDFAEIKKLALLNKNEVVNFRVNDGNIEFFDTRWTIKVGEAKDYEDTEWMFNVKYFKTINSMDNLNFYVFNQFLLIKENNEVYMIALEMSI